MSKLEKMLLDWTSEGLINDEQAKNIETYEANKPGSSWVLYAFLTLGVSIIGIGVISLIAANWSTIPSTVKLSADFILLISLAIGAYRAHTQKKPVAFDVFLVAFLISCLASIGLISQIYHTGGKLYQALLFWALITPGVAASARRYFTPLLWTIGFMTGIAFTAANFYGGVHQFYRADWNAILMLITLLSTTLILIFTHIPNTKPQIKALTQWAFLSWGVSLFFVDFQLRTVFRSSMYLTSYTPGYILALATTVGVLVADYKKSQKILLLVALAFFLIPFHFPLVNIKSDFTHSITTILSLTSIALFLASREQRRSFQIIISIIGLRFLILYFQAFGGLATTGFGLIISGILIISSVIAWNKYRIKLSTWAEGLL